MNLTLQILEIIPWLGHWWSYSRDHVSEGRCSIDNVQATNSGKQRSIIDFDAFRHDHVLARRGIQLASPARLWHIDNHQHESIRQEHETVLVPQHGKCRHHRLARRLGSLCHPSSACQTNFRVRIERLLCLLAESRWPGRGFSPRIRTSRSFFTRRAQHGAQFLTTSLIWAYIVLGHVQFRNQH